MDRLRIGLIQMRCEKGAVPENLAVMAGHLNTAARLDIDIVAFPEMCLTGYADPNRFPHAVVTRNGPEVASLLQRTRGFAGVVLAGIIEANPHGKPFITQIAVRNGELIGVYRKITIIDEEADWFSPGDQTLTLDLRQVTGDRLQVTGSRQQGAGSETEPTPAFQSRSDIIRPKGRPRYPAPAAGPQTPNSLGGPANGWDDDSEPNTQNQTPNTHLCVGLAICADIMNPDVFSRTAAAGARLIFELAAPGLYGEQSARDWASGYSWWEDECRTRLGAYAREWGVWIAVATQAGRTIDEDFPGGGFVFDPDGRCVFATPDGAEGAAFLELDLENGRATSLTL